MNMIHPEYVRIYNELRDEQLNEKRPSARLGVRHTAQVLSQGAHTSSSPLMMGIMGALLLVSLVIGVQLGREIGMHSKVMEANQIRHTAKENEAMKEQDAELDLIKRILFGLVEYMKEMSQGRKSELTPKEQNGFPRPISVVVDKATLRQLPDANSKSRALVDRGTALLALKEGDNWFQVISPFGDEAWIRKDLVVYEDEL